MKILGIESSSLVASVAVTDNGVTIAEYTVNFKKTHSQTLLPMLDEVVQMIGLDLKEIDAIAVSGGPGSFTGLRIGSATAKGLGSGTGQAADSYSDHRCHGIQSVRHIGTDLPDDGCAQKPGLHRTVSF